MYLSERPRPTTVQAGSTDRPDRTGRVAPTVLLLGVVSLLTDISSESTASVLPLYLTLGLGLSPLAYGFVDAVYQGTSVLVRVLGGWWADRFDRPKPVAVAGYGLSALARVAFLSASGLAGVTTWLGLDRVGKGLRTAPRDSLIATASDPRSLGRAFGVHRALDTTGAVLGPCLAFAVLAALPGDYSAVFVISCAAALLGLALLVLLVPDLRPSVGATASQSPNAPPSARARPSLRLLAQPRLARLFAASGLLGLLTIGDGFVYLALEQRADVALRFFPLLFVGTGLSYLALAIPFGRLADRVGRAALMVGGHAFLVGAYVCVALPVGDALVPLTLLLLGAFYAATDGVLSAATVSVAPPGGGATAIATAQSVVAVARMVAALAFGWLWLQLGAQHALMLMAGLLVCAIGVAWWLVRGAVPEWGQA
jgi:MFS family permease